MLFRVNQEKINVLSRLFSEAGYDFFVKFDQAEPEYKVFSRIYETWRDARFAVVLGVGTALIDFSLPKGGAETFWREFEWTTYRLTGFKRELKPTLELASSILRTFVMQSNACFKDRYDKVAVTEKYLSSYARKLWERDYKLIRSNPEKIWYELLQVTGRRIDYKPIVFAMKIIDLLSHIIYGEYASFSETRYLPLDFHIARITLLSGLIEPMKTGITLEKAIRILRKQKEYRELVFEAWSSIATNTTEAIGRKVSPLRIDSVLWQIGRQIPRRKTYKKRPVTMISNYMVGKTGVDYGIAKRIAEELLTNYDYWMVNNMEEDTR